MKIYNKPTERKSEDKELFELLMEDKIKIEGIERLEAANTLSDEDQRLDALLSDAKVEFDEAWMAEAMEHAPSDLEMRLQATLDMLEEQEEPACSAAPDDTIQMTAHKQAEPPQIGRRLWMRVAASIVIILTIGIGMNMQGSNNAFADTCKTPEEAQAHLERALALMNSHSQKAIDKADETLQQVTVQRKRDLSKYISFE